MGGITTPTRRIVHVDMDAFFASIEQLRRPELIGRPVIVGGRGDPTERGVVSAASYEARRRGVHSAMPLRRAARLAPDAVFLPVDMARYEEVSSRLMAALRGVAGRVEPLGLDEAYVEVPVGVATTDFVASLKAAVLAATGVTCSVGVGPNKLVAKIASDLDKPDGLTVIEPDEWAARIGPKSVRVLPGVGPKTARRLAGAGVDTVAELVAVPHGELELVLKPALARHLWLAARGIDERPLVSGHRQKSLGRETTYQRDLETENELLRELEVLAVDVAKMAMTKGVAGRRVSVKVRTATFTTFTRDRTLDAVTNRSDQILAAARDGLARVELRHPVRLLGIRLSKLESFHESSR